MTALLATVTVNRQNCHHSSRNPQTGSSTLAPGEAVEARVDVSALSEQYTRLLECCARELLEDNRHRITRAELLPTRHAIPVDELRLFFLGLQHGVREIRSRRSNGRGLETGSSSTAPALDPTPGTGASSRPMGWDYPGR